MIKPADVRAAIKTGDTQPLYLLEGDDLHSRHDLALEFGGVVPEGLEAFNVESFHGNEATSASARDEMMGAIVAGARTLPMMAPRRVVIVHEADRLLSPKRAKDDEEPAPVAASGKRRRAATPAEDFEAFLEAPEPMTTVVFVAGPLDANRRLVKLLRKKAVVVDCGSLDSVPAAAAWVRKRLEQDELTIEPKALGLLIEATGLHLGRLRAEVEKLVLYAAGDATVTESQVRDLLAPQSEPGEDFALGKAIWAGSLAEALREVGAQIDAGAPPYMVLGQLRVAAGRLRPDARARSGLDRVLQTDLALKSSAGDPRHLLECLVVELCGR